MKRAGNLFPKLISDSNIRTAIETVCRTHRWHHYPDKPNRTVLWILSTMDDRVREMRTMILEGFEPSPVRKKKRYDHSAGKWREIAEPMIWPDQCVHHALIQVLEPMMMRGMDHWCCGSIQGRGTHYGIKAMKKWMKRGKGTKYCVELDIRHFYDSLRPEIVLARFRKLIKDRRVLDLVWSVIKDGIQIGAYCSQWFANTVLQPLDQLIRKSGASHYIRYMDNFTILTKLKRDAHKLVIIVGEWLRGQDLRLKDNWQVFRTSGRLPDAMGYRFGSGYTLIRKKNLIRLKHQLSRYGRLYECGKHVTAKFAQGLLSRLGMLRHCNSTALYEKIYKRKTQKRLKDVVRDYYRRETDKWNTYLEQCAATAGWLRT